MIEIVDPDTRLDDRLGPSLEIKGASLAFGSRRIFSDLDLHMGGGAWTVLLGPSGVGKSSLLRLAAGLTDPWETTGTVTAGDGNPLTNRIAYMAQQDLLFPWASVLDNVLTGIRLRGAGKTALRDGRERAMALLERVGLADRASALPGELSGGMRQRAALARTLMEDRPFVLMDEPFSALDALTRHRLQAEAVELLQGRTVLLVTHDPGEAVRVGDALFTLSGTPVELHPVQLNLPGAPPRPPDTAEFAHLVGELLKSLGARRSRSEGEHA